MPVVEQTAQRRYSGSGRAHENKSHKIVGAGLVPARSLPKERAGTRPAPTIYHRSGRAHENKSHKIVGAGPARSLPKKRQAEGLPLQTPPNDPTHIAAVFSASTF